MAQRRYIQFCVKNEIKFARTFEMSNIAFGESTMSRTQVQLWYKGLRKMEKISVTMRSTSTVDEHIEALNKIILNDS